MKLSLGIVGLPNVGKSTLFKLLTQKEVLIANYPFATIDPTVGVVAVPDARVDLLSALSKSKKTVPAVVEFYQSAAQNSHIRGHCMKFEARVEAVRFIYRPQSRN